jgi:hypothetical protein
MRNPSADLGANAARTAAHQYDFTVHC